MAVKAGTFERRMEMLFLILNIKETTIPTLQRYFSVSENTICRDLEALSRYAPIYTRSGKYGGVFLLKGYKSDLKLHLSTDEKELLEQLVKTSNAADARLLQNILHKYAMPSTEV